jgi:hypothetical protein
MVFEVTIKLNTTLGLKSFSWGNINDQVHQAHKVHHLLPYAVFFNCSLAEPGQVGWRL